MHHVNVISGRDQFHGYNLLSDEAVAITLYLDDNSNNQLSLFYQLKSDRLKQVWQGPRFNMGESYRIHVTLSESGDIAEEHCRLPCEL